MHAHTQKKNERTQHKQWHKGYARAIVTTLNAENWASKSWLRRIESRQKEGRLGGEEKQAIKNAVISAAGASYQDDGSSGSSSIEQHLGAAKV